jgi:cytidine deaminase
MTSSIETRMIEMLAKASEYSRPALSNFRVGAVALGASGELYLGANIEIAGNALNQTVHAEQAALANAFAHRERGITAIAVTAAPCGHCRQFMNEIDGASQIRVLVQGQKSVTLGELLPASFGPKDLGITAGLFNGATATLRFATETRQPLALVALEAAARAYAPHTNALSGCAVRTRSGEMYEGSYLENAAFNPSLSPLQSALVNIAMAGEEFGDIMHVALVELQDATISHRPSTAAALAALSPGARADYFTALRSS